MCSCSMLLASSSVTARLQHLGAQRRQDAQRPVGRQAGRDADADHLAGLVRGGVNGVATSAADRQVKPVVVGTCCRRAADS
jgi:hypothetical protein